MNSKLSFGPERLSKRVHSFSNLAHQQSPARIDEINTTRSVRFHQSPLLGQATWAIHVRHHQETDSVHSEASSGADVFGGNIRLSAVSSNSYDRCSSRMCSLEIANGTYARQQ